MYNVNKQLFYLCADKTILKDESILKLNNKKFKLPKLNIVYKGNAHYKNYKNLIRENRLEKINMDYKHSRWQVLTRYKNDVLNIHTVDTDKQYTHFLTGEYANKTFYNYIKVIRDKNLMTLPNGNKITLQKYWKHMNSSQVLCINFFLRFWNKPEELKTMLDSVVFHDGCTKIIGNPKKLIFEEKIDDKTNVDLTIELDTGKKVYIEVKYTESEFGEASSKKTNYSARKKRYYDSVEVSPDDYKKYYQFIRNIRLGTDGNYSVFLYPKNNKSINDSFEASCKAVKNLNNFKFGRLYWEDLVELLPDNETYMRYFSNDEDWK